MTIEKTSHQFENYTINVDESLKGHSLKVDRTLFQMMCMNLITNAFNHNEHSSKKLNIISQSDSKNLSVIFIDNGKGFSSSQKKDLFRKFYQVGKSVKGSGLGLYMVQSIMKIHGGSVHADSEGVGLGASFSLNFLIGKDNE